MLQSYDVPKFLKRHIYVQNQSSNHLVLKMLPLTTNNSCLQLFTNLAHAQIAILTWLHWESFQNPNYYKFGGFAFKHGFWVNGILLLMVRKSRNSWIKQNTASNGTFATSTGAICFVQQFLQSEQLFKNHLLSPYSNRSININITNYIQYVRKCKYNICSLILRVSHLT